MFVRAAQDGGTANAFFGAFPYVQELVRGNYSATLHQGIALLEKCRQLDPITYQTIHKGTPFYWLGTAAFLIHDYQNALFYYDTAVSEDLRAHAHPVNNPTPGLYFIQLNGDPPEQAARTLVQITQEKVQRALDGYNARPGASALSLPGEGLLMAWVQHLTDSRFPEPISETSLRVLGSLHAVNEHLHFTDNLVLKIGDEVRVRVIETNEPTEPVNRVDVTPPNPPPNSK